MKPICSYCKSKQYPRWNYEYRRGHLVSYQPCPRCGIGRTDNQINSVFDLLIALQEESERLQRKWPSALIEMAGDTIMLGLMGKGWMIRGHHENKH